jgi:penicillin-binding protein 1A
MLELDFITEEEFATALDTPVVSKLHGPKLDLEAPYVAEMARDEAVRRLGETATTDGYQVITTIDSRTQHAAGNALRTALLEYDRRHGFRGAVTRVDITGLTAAQAATQANSSNPSADGETVDAKLQNILRTYPVFGDLHSAVVTRIYPRSAANGPAANSAEFFVRDTGFVTIPWDSIKWRPFINDNAVGAAPETVADMLAAGDVVYLRNTAKGWQLSQVPVVQGALVAMDPQDGATAALTGGFDFFQSKFNRAAQALRQPGSSFKPFIYSAALDNGFTVSSIVNDAPIVLDASAGQDAWRPQNYSRKFYGPTRLREGLVRSMNLVTVRVLMKIGMKKAFKHLRPFGFDDAALPPNLSLALGSGGASPWLMAQAFSGLSSGGYGVKRHIIDRILDAEGNLIYEASEPLVCAACAPNWFDGRETNLLPEETEAVGFLSGDEPIETQWNEAPVKVTSDPNAIDPEIPFYESAEAMMAHALEWRPDYTETPNFWSERNQADRIVSAQNAYIVYDMMRDVIRRGTGQRAKALGREDLAGKTGTSNDRRDAWFGGFNSQLVGVAWVGFDDDARTLGEGEEGGRTALPMWINLMDVALKGTAEAPLMQPPGIVSMRVSRNSGQQASAGSPDAMFEIFIAGSEPGSGYDRSGMGTDDIFVEDTSDASLF